MAQLAHKRGRPPLKPGQRKRNNVTIRLRDAMRTELQLRAAAEGRSLSEEMEVRLERSMLEEAARYEDLGGEGLYSIFRFLGSAAKLVEARTGKSLTADWDTWSAVRAAWRKLIPALGPRPSGKYLKLVEAVKKRDQEVPKLFPWPTPPKLPKEPSDSILDPHLYMSDGERKVHAQKWAEYEKQMVAHHRQLKAQETQLRKQGQRLERLREHLDRIASVGEGAALELLPDVAQPKR